MKFKKYYLFLLYFILAVELSCQVTISIKLKYININAKVDDIDSTYAYCRTIDKFYFGIPVKIKLKEISNLESVLAFFDYSEKVKDSDRYIDVNILRKKSIVAICYDLEMDSCGGVDFSIRFCNLTNKIIKYVYFNVNYYNEVDDKIKSTIDFSNSANYRYKRTGFIEPGEISSLSTWSGFYNTTTSYYRIYNISVIYKDGSTKSFQPSDVLNLYNQ